MGNSNRAVRDHRQVTRRRLFHAGGMAGIVWGTSRMLTAAEADAGLQAAIAKLEYLTPPDRAYILDKGNTGISKLAPEAIRQIGLTQDTWSLDVVPDPASNSQVEHPLSRTLGTALDWSRLMGLARTHAVRFLHVCTCTNGADPFHMTLWEGVPLREVLWLVQPKAAIRRVYYQSYHPDNVPPFQASLPLGRILENPPGEMPVILAYRMNGRLIPASHGGPVRIVVLGAYGNKSIKWVQRIVLTNDYKANDSDAGLNNDTESPLKTRARFMNAPKEFPPNTPTPVIGMAQVGVSELSKVQYCVHAKEHPWPEDDPYWTKADWRDAAILPPPADWGGSLLGGRLPTNTSGIDPASGRPLQWPMRYTLVHWAGTLPGLRPGRYDLCCRTIDGNGIAQPMPRPLPRTGFNTIHRIAVVVKA